MKKTKEKKYQITKNKVTKEKKDGGNVMKEASTK